MTYYVGNHQMQQDDRAPRRSKLKDEERNGKKGELKLSPYEVQKQEKVKPPQQQR